MTNRIAAVLACLAIITTPFASACASQSDPLPRRGAFGAPLAPVPADEAGKLGLKPGEGVVLRQPISGLTAALAGLKAGDVLVQVNGKPVVAQGVSALFRELPAGREAAFTVFRSGQKMEVKAVLQERPRDPGTSKYSVVYSHVVSNGQRMRTILTIPKKAGKHPGFMFIQGFSPVSYDFTLSTSTGDVTTLDGPILHHFAENDYVTLRIEKPGVGDSEGGPFAELDYTTELDIYRQALKQLKEHSAVDAENVFIFGHSMGGAFGPMIAVENPVRGIAVYGTAARTWFEYLLDTLRYQGLVGGGTFQQADDEVRLGSRLFALAFHEGKSAEEIKKAHPELAAFTDAMFPGGKFNGKALVFWAQLGQVNFADYWSRVNCRVLAVRGESDFVTYDADHKLIADIVNRARPGWGEFKIAPSSDHLFHNFKTEPEAMKNYSKGAFNPAFIGILEDWIKRSKA